MDTLDVMKLLQHLRDISRYLSQLQWMIGVCFVFFFIFFLMALDKLNSTMDKINENLKKMLEKKGFGQNGTRSDDTVFSWVFMC